MDKQRLQTKLLIATAATAALILMAKIAALILILNLMAKIAVIAVMMMLVVQPLHLQLNKNSSIDHKKLRDTA